MALVTLCPTCGTTFRVHAEQLQAHGGKVCCGQCRSFFNGFSTLITVDESEMICSSRTVGELLEKHGPETVSAHDMFADGGYDDCPESSPPSPSSSPSDWIDEEISFDQEERQELSPMWSLASLFMLILLVGQLTYVFRMELTETIPNTRPYLEKYCAIFSCTLPFPQQIDLLSIEASDLQVNPKNQTEVITLTATIRNHATFSQALPQLELSLTDTHNKLLSSRILTVEDYLQDEIGTVEFIPPHQEIDIKVHFDGSNLNATGYHLLLKYL